MTRPTFQRARDEGERSARRDALLASGRHLFEKSGWAGVTMAAVAADAGVAKGTTYLYFPTKEALFLALLTVELEAWIQSLLPRLQPGLGASDAARAFAATLADRPLLVRLLGHLHGTLEAGADAESLRAFKTALVGVLAQASPCLEAALGPGTEGLGVRLFLHTHAIVVGLAQMSDEPPALAVILDEPAFAAMRVRFDIELERALSALFAGVRP